MSIRQSKFKMPILVWLALAWSTGFAATGTCMKVSRWYQHRQHQKQVEIENIEKSKYDLAFDEGVDSVLRKLWNTKNGDVVEFNTPNQFLSYWSFPIEQSHLYKIKVQRIIEPCQSRSWQFCIPGGTCQTIMTECQDPAPVIEGAAK